MKRAITGKQALLIVLILMSVLFYLVVFQQNEPRRDKIILFFASSDYHSLVKEERKIRSDRTLKEKLTDTAYLLIYGNLGHSSRSLISVDTRLKSLFFFDGELHLNFSREFLNKIDSPSSPSSPSPSPLSLGSMVINSILATYFTSHKEVDSIYIYVEYKELNTLDGDVLFVYPYTRDVFLDKAYSSNKNAVRKLPNKN